MTRNQATDDRLIKVRMYTATDLGNLHNRYYPEIYQYIWTRVKDEPTTERITREVFLSLISTAYGAHPPERNVSIWLADTAATQVSLWAAEKLAVETYPVSGMPSPAMRIDQEAQELSQAEFIARAAALQAAFVNKQPEKNWGRGLFYLLLAGLLIGAVYVYAKLPATLPGETLYPIKRGVEQIRWIIADDLSRRLELDQVFNTTRIQEVSALLSQGQQQPVQLTGGLEKMSLDEWLVDGLRVKVPDNLRLVGQVQAGWLIDLAGITQSDGTLLAQSARPHELVLEGKVQRIDDDILLVDGTNIAITPQTSIQGFPQLGSQVRLRVFRLLDERVLARWIEVLDQ
jgi:hypothetical protein